MSTGGAVVLVLLSALFFGLGFGVSWVRARRRLRARMTARLQEEMERRIAQEVLQRLHDGKLAERVDAAMREEAAEPPAPQAGETASPRR